MMFFPPLAGMLLMHRDDLSLTADQVQRLQAIQADALKADIRRRADVQIAMVDLMQLMQQPTPDRGKIDNAIRDVGRQVSDLAIAQSHAFLDARNVLTPEQRQKLESMHARMMRGMGGMGGPMGGMGPMMGGMGGPMGGGAF